jgi:hypothetical protein
MSSFYDSPTAEDPPDQTGGPEGDTKRRLCRVANYQRLVLLGIGGHLLAITVVALEFFNFLGLPDLVLSVGVVFLIASSLFNAATVFLAKREITTGPSTWIYSIAAAIPVVGLVSMGLANIAATGFLQDKNVRVGLLGADPGQFR